MATFYFFKINSEDLFLSNNEGKLDLNECHKLMVANTATKESQNNAVNGEGFIHPLITRIGSKEVIISNCVVQGSLGYYNQAFFGAQDVTSVRVQQTFYSQARVIFTEDYEVILYFDYSEEISGKAKATALIEKLGFELERIRFNHEKLNSIKEKFNWKAAKLEKIDRTGDSTRMVSYEIDQADEYTSKIDELYNEFGRLSHLSFDFRVDDTNKITIKLYKDNHGFIAI
ncbi:hypothetical protein [Trichococcus shcherbakoviae]|uniref:Uncharacterized protein n=1 Tax=Trichococcus shcherbakoviae TaxID=2094020 RepID=A0A383TC79_9LACT|nr:hypothetical protein [Trichococcus shcherbakoviae]SYZ77244.1 Hypothetical protein TART1_0006 [Trichococcus shcherbakoviae]